MNHALHQITGNLKRPGFGKNPRVSLVGIKQVAQVKMGGIGGEGVVGTHADVPVAPLIYYLHLGVVAGRQGVIIVQNQCLLARLFPLQPITQQIDAAAIILNRKRRHAIDDIIGDTLLARIQPSIFRRYWG